MMKRGAAAVLLLGSLIILIGISSFFMWWKLMSVRGRLPITTIEQHNAIQNMIDGLGRLSNSLIILKNIPDNRQIRDEAAINLDICYSLYDSFKEKIPDVNSKKYDVAIGELRKVLDDIDKFINDGNDVKGIEVQALWTNLDEVTVLINSAYLDSNEKVTMRLIEEGKTIDNIMKVLIVSYLIMIAAVGFIGGLFRYQQKILTELNDSKQEILKINKSLEMLSVLNENIWKKSHPIVTGKQIGRAHV